ncbi:MAG: hypothetical protein HW397_21 [Dehalococcoidia bacterium]|nr:hypothetical protein [Dehalococcoidia bacterium]
MAAAAAQLVIWLWGLPALLIGLTALSLLGYAFRTWGLRRGRSLERLLREVWGQFREIVMSAMLPTLVPTWSLLTEHAYREAAWHLALAAVIGLAIWNAFDHLPDSWAFLLGRPRKVRSPWRRRRARQG